MPYILTAALFRMLDSIQQFDIIYAMTQGGPGDTLMVFQVQAYLEFFTVHQCRPLGGDADGAVADRLSADPAVHQALAAPARARARARPEDGRDDRTSPSAASSAASCSLVGLFFLFPIFWVFLMSFQTNEQILRIPPSLFFEPTLENYTRADLGQAGDAPPARSSSPFMRNLWNSVASSAPARCCCRCCSACPRPTPSPASSSGSARTSPSRCCRFRFAPPLLVLLPLSLYFPARPDRHLYRPDLGLPAHHPAADLVDRARLFRGHQPGHRARLPHRRP